MKQPCCMLLVGVLLLFIGASHAAVGNAAPGTVIWTSTFWATNSLSAWNAVGSFSTITSTSLGYNGKSALKIVSTSTSTTANFMINQVINLDAYGGCTVSVTPRVQATSVSTPAHSYLGLKTMLVLKSPTQATANVNAPSVSGTFAWSLTEDAFQTTLFSDINSATIYVGLQGVTGTAYWDKIVIQVVSCPNYKAPTTAPTKAPTAAPKAPTGVATKAPTGVATKAPTGAATKAPTTAPTTAPGGTIVSPGHAGIPRMRGTMVPWDINADFYYSDLSGWGANVFRWQTTTAGTGTSLIDPTDMTQYSTWCDNHIITGKAALTEAGKHQMKMVVDNHSPPGGNVMTAAAEYYPILAKKVYQDALVACWSKWATAFKGDKAVWGYDIMNEPHWVGTPPTPDADAQDWPGLAQRLIDTIRAIDPVVPIIVEPIWWASPLYLNQLPIFTGGNIIYSIHFYGPNSFATQTTTAPITYPGTISGTYWDKAKILSYMQPARTWQLANKVPIYVGEFSAPRTAPGAAQFISDCISVWEEFGWDWTYHCFREATVWNVECPDTGNPTWAQCDVTTDRKIALLAGLAPNVKPPPMVTFSLNETSGSEYYNETASEGFWEVNSSEAPFIPINVTDSMSSEPTTAPSSSESESTPAPTSMGTNMPTDMPSDMPTDVPTTPSVIAANLVSSGARIVVAPLVAVVALLHYLL